MNTKFLLLFLALGVAFSSCVKDPNTEPLPEEKLIDVAYGAHVRNKMDVYLPEGRSERTAVVVLVHGGAWVGGDKADIRIIQEQFLRQGIATVSINHRYASAEVSYVQLMEDVGAALSLLKNNASDLGVKNSGYVLAGFSSGAHIALLYAYDHQREGEVSSVVSIAGPTGFNMDMISLPGVITLRQPIEWVVGATISAPLSPLFAEASPLTHVSAAVPTLMIHGEADELVPFSQSTQLKAALDGANVRNQLLQLNNTGHNVIANPANILTILNTISVWIR